MEATRLDPGQSLGTLGCESIEASDRSRAGNPANLGGALPRLFAEVLGLPTLWVPILSSVFAARNDGH